MNQRADTPRTAAGRALLHRVWPKPEGFLADLLAIEAEAAADSLRSVGPAAAEPHHFTDGCLQRYQEHVTALDPERAAQPPRGSANASENSLPDPLAEAIRLIEDEPGFDHGITLDGGDEFGAGMQSAPDGLWIQKQPILTRLRELAGGSLTATEPTRWLDQESGRPHENTYEVGSPRGVTPALDVERLARAMRRVYRGAPEHDSLALGDAELIAAEYARLGSLSLQGSPDQEDS